MNEIIEGKYSREMKPYTEEMLPCHRPQERRACQKEGVIRSVKCAWSEDREGPDDCGKWNWFVTWQQQFHLSVGGRSQTGVGWSVGEPRRRRQRSWTVLSQSRPLQGSGDVRRSLEESSGWRGQCVCVCVCVCVANWESKHVLMLMRIIQ